MNHGGRGAALGRQRANCSAVIETHRGHTLGRLIWQGAAREDPKIPESIGERRDERVLRAPSEGILKTLVEIGAHCEPGQAIAEVNGQVIQAPFAGVLRGILRNDLPVTAGLKIGDLDPRDDPLYSRMISEKSLSVGGGVLEAILSRPEIRGSLWI